jgi:hypothetical protein
MKIWVNLLNDLDNFFEEKSENEKWMLIVVIFGVILYFSYAFFFDDAESQYNDSVVKKERLQSSISKNKDYLNSITRNGDRNFLVKKYDSEIATLKKSTNSTHDDITFISSSLDELSSLMFNKESWSKFLNSITKQAKDENIEINYIENEYVETKGSFGHILQISIGCNGSYRNIVKFLNRLEKNVLVTDIYESSIYLNKNQTKVKADIKISVWGINH